MNRCRADNDDLFAERQAFFVTITERFSDKCVTIVESLNRYNEKSTAPESREAIIKVGIARRMQISSRRIEATSTMKRCFFYGREPDCATG